MNEIISDKALDADLQRFSDYINACTISLRGSALNREPLLPPPSINLGLYNSKIAPLFGELNGRLQLLITTAQSLYLRDLEQRIISFQERIGIVPNVDPGDSYVELLFRQFLNHKPPMVGYNDSGFSEADRSKFYMDKVIRRTYGIYFKNENASTSLTECLRKAVNHFWINKHINFNTDNRNVRMLNDDIECQISEIRMAAKYSNFQSKLEEDTGLIMPSTFHSARKSLELFRFKFPSGRNYFNITREMDNRRLFADFKRIVRGTGRRRAWEAAGEG